MKIDLATIQDVPALLDLQRKAFDPLCEELDWKDAPVLTESLEHAYEEFARCTTLKVQNDEGLIIGSVNPKTVIRISQCCMAVRNPLAFPILKGTIVVFSTTLPSIGCACLSSFPDMRE